MAVQLTTLADAAPATAEQAELSALEVEVVDLFVNALRLLGMPRSLGEIYGLLFISPVALTLDDLVTRLKISKGSASQGIKMLKQIGAVKATYVSGDRRDHFTAETELKKLAVGFLNGQVLPHLDAGESRMGRLKALQHENSSADASVETRAFYEARLKKLDQWRNRALELAPLLGRILD